MSKKYNQLLRQVSLSQISGYHSTVVATVKVLARQNFTSRLDVLSEETIFQLLNLHPIGLVKQKNNQYFVISGFRSYQMALGLVDENTKLPALIYSLTDKEIFEMAQTDVLGSVLLHSLGSKSVSQIEVLKKHIGLDATAKIAPGLNSSRAVTRFEKLK